MESYKITNLLNNVETDLKAYTKALTEMSHLQLKAKEYGVKVSDAETELLDRLSDLVDALESVKNQAKEMQK